MKRTIRHIRASNNEWVQVHRTPSPPSSGNDVLWGLLFRVGGGIILFVIACQIIKAVLPFLVQAALGWIGLTVFCKWK